MGLMETFVSAPILRAPSPSYELDGDNRADPELGFSWSGEEPVADDYTEPAQLFLVVNQTGTSPRGEPLFGSPVRSGDDNLARAFELMAKHDVIADTLRRAVNYGEMARDAIAPLPDSPEKRALIEAIDYCIARAN